MQEPEVSLYIAIKCIEEGWTSQDVTVSIDGAHIKTADTVHFDLVQFMHQKGYEKSGGVQNRWQGAYQKQNISQKIIVSSQPGVGDVVVALHNGSTLYIESKKFKSGSGGEYPAMREAIGQLMTGCPDRPNITPVVAVPYSEKSEELARKWSCNERIRSAGICFILVYDNGNVIFINGNN